MRLRDCGLVLAVLLLAGGCEEDGLDVGQNDPRRITAMGDSITEAGWPEMLVDLLGASVINRGVGGAVSADGAAAVERALAADRPGFLLIAYGINDVGRGYSTGHIVENLRTMIRAARIRSTEPVVATLTPVYGARVIFSGRIRSVNARIRALGAEEGVRVADVHEAFGTDRSLVGDDGLHPTEAGLRVIASVYFNALRHY